MEKFDIHEVFVVSVELNREAYIIFKTLSLREPQVNKSYGDRNVERAGQLTICLHAHTARAALYQGEIGYFQINLFFILPLSSFNC